MPRLALDLTPLRHSRDLRLLMLGDFVTAIGTQAALVALPYQVYSLTHSAFLTGLLGAVELGPLMAMALWGGALADRTTAGTCCCSSRPGSWQERPRSRSSRSPGRRRSRCCSCWRA
jgi:MFS family permease